MPSRRAILAAVAALSIGLTSVALVASAAVDPVQSGLVTTTDGRALEGEITDNGESVTVNVRGVSTTLDKTAVLSIDYSTFADRFRDRLAVMGESDITGRLTLAREALARNEYELSLSAIDAALAIDPLDRDARRMANAVTRQMALDQASTRAAAAEQSQPPATEVGAEENDVLDEPTRLSRLRGLDSEQINRLRQIELQPGERVRVRFMNNVRRRFVDSQANLDIRSFIRRNDADQAFQIINGGTRDMVEDVKMVSDPISIQTFGKRIHLALVQGCATSGCHGGDGAGNFRLIGTRPTAQTMITNYYLIATYRRPAAPAPAADAAPGDRSPFAGGAIDMVERTRGEQSLLYQYALPRRFASSKHPVVRGWDGIVRTANDRLARDIAEWMNFDLGSVRPDYGDIEYTLPPRTATGEPATQPMDAPIPAGPTR